MIIRRYSYLLTECEYTLILSMDVSSNGFKHPTIQRVFCIWKNLHPTFSHLICTWFFFHAQNARRNDVFFFRNTFKSECENYLNAIFSSDFEFMQVVESINNSF